jgi:Mn2+/Fe2+ NRAMP family transporter
VKVFLLFLLFIITVYNLQLLLLFVKVNFFIFLFFVKYINIRHTYAEQVEIKSSEVDKYMKSLALEMKLKKYFTHIIIYLLLSFIYLNIFLLLFFIYSY